MLIRDIYKVEVVAKDHYLLQTKSFLLNNLFFNPKVQHVKCFKSKLKKLLNGVIGSTCLIYSSLSWFIFAPLVLMTFKLHSQLFPTWILTPVLKSPYDSYYACDLSGGEWEDMQAYGRSFLLEWIWAKHIPFKHMRIECLYP